MRLSGSCQQRGVELYSVVKTCGLDTLSRRRFDDFFGGFRLNCERPVHSLSVNIRLARRVNLLSLAVNRDTVTRQA